MDIKGVAKMATHPSQITLVDQLESTFPGFIAQLKGVETKTMLQSTTKIFVRMKTTMSLLWRLSLALFSPNGCEKPWRPRW